MRFTRDTYRARPEEIYRTRYSGDSREGFCVFCPDLSPARGKAHRSSKACRIRAKANDGARRKS